MNNDEMSADFLSLTLSRIINDISILESGTPNERSLAAKMLMERIKLLQDYSAALRENGAPDPTIDTTVEQPQLPKIIDYIQAEPEQTFTLSELAKYNGKDGMPAYVAYNGVVYDVSASPRWAFGKHFGLLAGKNLTIEYTACHAGRPTLENLPIVGRMVAETVGGGR